MMRQEHINVCGNSGITARELHRRGNGGNGGNGVFRHDLDTHATGKAALCACDTRHRKHAQNTHATGA